MKRALSEITQSSDADYYEIVDQKDITPAPPAVTDVVMDYILTKFSYYQRFEIVLKLYWTCTHFRYNHRVIYILTTGDCNSRLVDRIHSYRPTFDWLFPGISTIRSGCWFKRLDTFQWIWHATLHTALPNVYHSPSYREMSLRCQKTGMIFPYVTQGIAKPRNQLSEAGQQSGPYEVYFWIAPCEIAALAFVYYCVTREIPLNFAICIPGNIWLVSGRGPSRELLIAVYREGFFLTEDTITRTFDFFSRWGTDQELWTKVQKCNGTEIERVGFFLHRWYATPAQLREK